MGARRSLWRRQVRSMEWELRSALGTALCLAKLLKTSRGARLQHWMGFGNRSLWFNTILTS